MGTCPGYHIEGVTPPEDDSPSCACVPPSPPGTHTRSGITARERAVCDEAYALLAASLMDDDDAAPTKVWASIPE